MKLVLENCPDHKKWLEPAFRVACQYFGITEKDLTVTLTVGDVPGAEFAGGGTAQDPYNPARLFIWLKENVVRGKPRNPLKKYNMIEVFCHEMFHVKQYLLDGLRDDRGRDGVWFRGKFYHGNEVMYIQAVNGVKALPWEEEAYGGMLELAKLVEHHLERHL